MATTIRFAMEDFATRVQARRRELGWSQTELAKRADLNLGNINEVEHARKSSVRAETIVALAVAMGVSTDYLLGLADVEVSAAPTDRATPPARQPTRTRQRPRTVTTVD